MSRYSKLIYGLLFALIVLEPHFITRHVLFIPRPYAESLVTLLIGGVAFLIYIVHGRDIKRKDTERLGIMRVLDQSTNKLKQAYEYIGKLNRRLPLLKNITTELLSRPKTDKKSRKTIFEDLLATAVISIVKAPWGLFRFIEVGRERTAREFIYNNGHSSMLHTKIGNKELLHRGNNQIVTERDDLHVVRTSDQESATRCVFIFPQRQVATSEADLQVLQAIVDQAQLFYKYVF